MRPLLVASLMGFFVLSSGLSGCFEGGANFHQQAPGNNDTGGVDLNGDDPWNPNPDDPDTVTQAFYGALAMAPDGSYFLSRSGQHLVYGDLFTGQTRRVAVSQPQKIVFANTALRFYVTSETREVLALEPGSLKVLWQASTYHLGTDVKIYATQDDKYLLAVGDDTLDVINAATGKLHAQLGTGSIHDVDLSPDSKTAIVTLHSTWGDTEPQTRILLLDLDQGVHSEILVPNCSSPLVLTPDGSKAFLAPTFCNKDPVSVIDLKAKKWVRNLPGFGPVAMAKDGVTAIAFMDATNLDMSLFDDPDQAPEAKDGQYHMMLLDTATLKFHTVPLGDELPRYTLTPDGNVVLVDHGGWWSDPGIRLLDVKTRKIQQVTGAPVKLDHFVVSPNSNDVYLLYYSDLYWLSIPGKVVKLLPTQLGWSAMNITPEGERLLMLDNAGTLHLYDLATASIIHSMVAPCE